MVYCFDSKPLVYGQGFLPHTADVTSICLTTTAGVWSNTAGVWSIIFYHIPPVYGQLFLPPTGSVKSALYHIAMA